MVIKGILTPIKYFKTTVIYQVVELWNRKIKAKLNETPKWPKL